MKYFGIDPASGKDSCIWKEEGYEFIKAQNVRSYVSDILDSEANCLISWDAPLSFGDFSYSDRYIDKKVRAWVKNKVNIGLFEKSSVNALPFSGLSHWVISCQALGLPFGDKLKNLSLYPHQEYQGENGQFLLEVHPAVAMACMWYEKDLSEPFPVYKKTKESRRIIVERLNFPEVCIENDDILDAFVAYEMSKGFAHNIAASPCSPRMGSYVLPKGKAMVELLEK